MLFYLFSILFSVVGLYLLVLILRAVIDWIRVFSPTWRPRGVVLVVANFIYAVTDPPLNFLRRAIPPLRLGAVAFDLGFLLFFIGLVLLQGIFQRLAFASVL